MNEQSPETPQHGQQPSGYGFGAGSFGAYGAGSGSEPTQPVPDGGSGFGTPPSQPPSYHQADSAGFGYPPTDPYRTTMHEQPGYGPGDSYPQNGQSGQQHPAPGASGPAAPPPATSRGTRRGPLMIASLALAAVIGAGAGIGSYAFLDHGSTTAASPVAVSTQKAPQQAKTDGSVEDAAKVIEPSVVTITVQGPTSGDIGSGVVLDKQGHILTNNHVVAAVSQNQGGFGQPAGGQSKITVTLSDGRTASATVVGTDETDDLAVIKIHGVKNLTPAHFAKSASLSTGQSVVAVGAPLGLSQSVTSGIVSNVARPVRSGENNDAVYLAVQTDAAINPGNSGGPLVDLNGSVVGINSSIASTDEGSSGSGQSGNIGIGFAIPSDVAVRVASQLIDSGKSSDAVLGVTISATDDSELGSTTNGVALRSVRPGSAAAKAGLRQGDVVTALNGFKVTTADGLIAATHYYAPGTTVTVTYSRDGTSHKTKATLGSN